MFMNLLATIKWYGKLSIFTSLQKIYVVLNSKASIVMQKLPRKRLMKVGRNLSQEKTLPLNHLTFALKIKQML